jgi:multidrug efflux pump subunit AcrA (membrane-fusion protein)
MADVAGEELCPGGAAPSYWKAPMDPTYIREEPGKSPMGMDLVPVCPEEGGQDAERGAVRVDSATVQTIGVRTRKVETRDLSRSIRAVGRVTYDERRVAHVHTKVQGWVERLSVDYVGQSVKRGQPLLEIYSPDLVATQEELLLALRYRDDTARSPFEEVRSSGDSLLDAARRRLELWDVPERDIERLLETGDVTRTLTLYAPVSGVVTELEVRSGMEVEPNSNLYTIADLSKVWVMADVYEYELPWLELGQTGVVELRYLPGAAFSGPVTYVSPFLDAKTRTAEVRLELPNPEGRLKPEMFANVMIQADPREDVTAIPSEAIIRSGRRTLAIVALGEGRFEPREIELGLETGERWTEITKGLRPGETVVVSSQFLIDSESKLQEAIQKLLTADALPAEPAEPQGQEAAPPHVHEHTPVDPPAMSPMHHAPQPPDPPEEHQHHHSPTSPSAASEGE